MPIVKDKAEKIKWRHIVRKAVKEPLEVAIFI